MVPFFFVIFFFKYVYTEFIFFRTLWEIFESELKVFSVEETFASLDTEGFSSLGLVYVIILRFLWLPKCYVYYYRNLKKKKPTKVSLAVVLTTRGRFLYWFPSVLEHWVNLKYFKIFSSSIFFKYVGPSGHPSLPHCWMCKYLSYIYF